MFGEILLVSAGTLLCASVSKGLEKAGKEKHAGYLDMGFKLGFAGYMIKKVNDLFKEFDNFL